jgi:hypothetical protein
MPAGKFVATDYNLSFKNKNQIIIPFVKTHYVSAIYIAAGKTAAVI